MVPELTDEQMDFIEDVLDKYALEDSFFCFNQVDGFITALVSAPNEIPKEEWLPKVLNEFGEEVDWENEDEKAQFFELLVQHYNYRVLVFMNQTEGFDAVIYADDEGLDIWNEWAEGYLRGMELDPVWEKFPKKFSDFKNALQYFGVSALDPEEKKLKPEKEELLREAMIPGILGVQSYWNNASS